MIHRLVFPTLFVVSLCTGLSAQLGVSIEASKRSFRSESVSEICGLYFASTDRHVEEPGSFLHVDVSLDESGIRQLEGMDIRASGEAICIFQAQNRLTEESACYRLHIPITGHSDKGSIETRVVRHLSTSKMWCDSLSEILDLISPSRDQDCSELVLLLENEIPEDWHASLLRVYRFSRTFRNCSERSSEILERKLEDIDQKYCDDVLYQATLLFNSGTNQNINQAVRKLLQVPPHSICRERALELSEANAKNYRLSGKSKIQLSKYIDALKVNNTDAWLEMQVDH